MDCMTIRGAVIDRVGAAPKVADFEEPVGGDGEVVVEVELAGLNPVDVSIANGDFGSVNTPYVAGLEGVGRTEPDGPLYYFGGATSPHGSFAPKALVKRDSLVELPSGVDPGQAIAFGIAGQAGWLSISHRSDLQPGEKVIVLGASGIVGQVAVSAARALGAGRIVAVARSEAGLQKATGAGADSSVQLSGEADDTLTEKLIEAAGGPADVVIDMLWGGYAIAALKATGRGARLVQIGNSSGESEISLPAGLMRGQAREIRGHTNGAVPDEVRREAYLEMCRRSIAGELKVDVEEVPLDRIAEAWDRQRNSPGRKLVIRP